MSPASEVWFYHLERRRIGDVLPDLLEKTLKRGWRALVRAQDPDLLRALDEALWTFRADAVLPHGRAEEPFAEDQPILLTGDCANVNGAQALFILGDAAQDGFREYSRCVVLFEDADLPAREAARSLLRTLRSEGGAAAYWRETERGFDKRAL